MRQLRIVLKGPGGYLLDSIMTRPIMEEYNDQSIAIRETLSEAEWMLDVGDIITIEEVYDGNDD